MKTSPSHPTRRTIVKGGLAVAVLAGTGAAITSRAAAQDLPPEQPGGQHSPLVVVFLRGGMDGLSACVPTGDADQSHLRAVRPSIAIESESTLPLDGAPNETGATFGLHPALAQLHERHRAGQLATIVAAGSPSGSRSHFSAQDLWESAEFSNDFAGWLGRHLTATAGPAESVFRAVSVSDNVAKSLAGSQALGLPSIDSFGLGGISGFNARRADELAATHHGSHPTQLTGQLTLQAVEEARQLDGSTNPNPTLRAFEDTATLLNAPLGTEIVACNIGHWDTHDNQGTVDGGEMRDLLGGLDEALSIVSTAATGPAEPTVVVMSEFGRRIAQNGAGGTDHGWGSVMFVSGPTVRGGLYGNWIPLDEAGTDPRWRGDVPQTTDFRDVFGDISVGVLGSDSDVVSPDHGHASLGIFE